MISYSSLFIPLLHSWLSSSTEEENTLGVYQASTTYGSTKEELHFVCMEERENNILELFTILVKLFDKVAH